MPELEERLTALARDISWPETPPLLPIHREVAAPSRRKGWALAAAAVVLIVATLLAYTPTREAIAGWLNLHTIIHRVENLPPTSPRPSGPVGARLDLGTQTTFDGAGQQVGWTVVVPSSLGSPDEVYVKLPPSGPSGGEVSLVYTRRSDISPAGTTGVSVLVSEARGAVSEPFFFKVLGPDATIEQITVDGHPAYWISGRPHDFAFTDDQGNPYFETMRLATNTLVFDDGGTLVRIEGDMTQAQAIEIARSMR